MYRDKAMGAGKPVTRRAILIGAIVVSVGRSRAATPPADVLGWGATRWGMNRDALQRAVGPSLVRLASPLAYRRLIVRDTLPNQRIAGRPFVALFQLDPETETLAQVVLRYRGAFPMLSDFVAIRDLLAKDYGPPHERRADPGDPNSIPSFWIEAGWRFPTTEIALSLVDPDAV